MGNKSHEELPLLAVPAAASPSTSPSAKAAAPPSPLPLEDAPLVPLRLQGVLMVAMSALLFSILSAFVKLESYSMPSMETVFWRSSIAWLLCLIVMRFYNVSVFVERQFWPALTARCFFGTCAMSLSFYAMQQMVLADASVLLATSPVTTFFLGAVLLGEHIDPISLCFALLSFVGVTCVSRPTWLFGAHAEDAATKAGSLVGALCCLLSATSVSFVYVSMRRLQQLHFLVVIHYFSLAATIASLVPLLWQGTFVVHMTTATWLASVGSGVVGFVGQLFLTRGFQLEKAGVASVMSYLNVVFVFIWDFVFLHETINPWSIVGAAIICGCAIMIVLRRMNHK